MQAQGQVTEQISGQMQNVQIIPGQTESKSKNFRIIFLFRGYPVFVPAYSEMTIEKLIKQFRNNLCMNDVNILKYEIKRNNIILDPSSKETLNQNGIDDSVIIEAYE